MAPRGLQSTQLAWPPPWRAGASQCYSWDGPSWTAQGVQGQALERAPERTELWQGHRVWAQHPGLCVKEAEQGLALGGSGPGEAASLLGGPIKVRLALALHLSGMRRRAPLPPQRGRLRQGCTHSGRRSSGGLCLTRGSPSLRPQPLRGDLQAPRVSHLIKMPVHLAWGPGPALGSHSAGCRGGLGHTKKVRWDGGMGHVVPVHLWRGCRLRSARVCPPHLAWTKGKAEHR